MLKRKTNKIKKIMAVFLSLALVLSVLEIPAKADDIINSATDVTFTVHRYKYKAGTVTPATATGAEVAPVGLDTDLQYVDGVGYTIYKIANIEQVGNQVKYEVVDATLKTLIGTIDAGSGKCYIDPAVSATDVYNTSGVQSRFADSTFTTKSAEKTTTSGMAQFLHYADGTTKLEKGLYLVVETTHVANVTSVNPYFVSLPMTKTDGSEWIYSVHAYPKTPYTENGITIYKYGKTAGAAASSAIAGATFKIQEQSGATWTDLLYNNASTHEAIGDTAGQAPFTVPITGKTINNLHPGTYRVIELTAPAPYIADSSIACEFTIATDGTITCTPPTGVTYDNGVITFTNETPTVEKKVKAKTAATYSDLADYSVDDTVTFKLEVTVPSNIDKLKTYKITDEFGKNGTDPVFDQVALTDVELKFYNGTNDVSSDVKPNGTSVFNLTTTEFSSDTNGFTINLSDQYLRNAMKNTDVTKVEVIYRAVLNNKAVIAGEGNLNTGKVEYTNHIYDTTDSTLPQPENDGGNPYEERTELTDEAAVYSFKLSIKKEFEGTETGLLATFDLYKTGTATAIRTGINVGKDATVEITGLSNGDYYFVETDTSNGYSLLKENVAAPIAINYSKATFKKMTITRKYNNAGEPVGVPTEIITQGAATTVYTGGDSPALITVVNSKASALPTTGGVGTLIFTAIGIALMAGGILIFSKSKKRQAN